MNYWFQMYQHLLATLVYTGECKGRGAGGSDAHSVIQGIQKEGL